MNPNDPYERNTVLEQYLQIFSNPDQDPHDWFQLPQNGPSAPQLSFPQYDGKSSPAIGTSYGSRDSHLHYTLLPQQQSQEPHDRLWQWYLGHSTKQRLVIGCCILMSLLLLGAIFGTIASAGPRQHQPQTATVQVTTVQITQTPTDQVPTPTTVTMLIPNPTLMPTPPLSPKPTVTPVPTPTPRPSPKPTPRPSPTPTVTPVPTPTPMPVEKVNVTVTSQMVKKIGRKYCYIFDILNNDSQSFDGRVTIALYNDRQPTPLGQQTFNMTQLLQPGFGSIVYFDIPTGPISQQSSNGITHFQYTILVNGQEANMGGGQITDQYEDTSLF